MQIVQEIMTNSYFYARNINGVDSRYRTFVKRGPLGLVLHSVGCSQPDAHLCIEHWNRKDFTAASVHAFIDANTGVVHQAMPWNFRAPHCGGDYNDTHLGIEMCECPDNIIHYIDPDHSSKVQIRNRSKALEMVSRTYRSAVELFANLCEQFNLDPLAPGVIVSHAEAHAMGKASNHGDPEHLWDQLGTGYTMRGFRLDVADLMRKHQAELDASKPEPTGDAHSKFADVATAWAKEKGLFRGDCAGNYSWRLQLDREAAATILYRFAGNSGMDVSGRADLSSFEDHDNVSSYAKDAVSWAVANGLMNGTTPTTLSPSDFCSRAQFVTMMWRQAGAPNVETEIPFTDVKDGSYYAAAAAWAFANRIVSGVTKTEFRPGDAITREQAATALYRRATL